MNLEKAVEDAIRAAQARGDFDNLQGKGKPLDLNAYFETPEDLRLAYTVLKNANLVTAEVELLHEIAALKEQLAATSDATLSAQLQKNLREKQLQCNVLLEQRKVRPQK